MTLLDSESAVYLCAMMRLVNTVICDGQQYWTCACQDSCNTRNTGVVHNSMSQAAHKPCIFTDAWTARKPCIQTLAKNSVFTLR